jgi:AbrB family looped-hinge helix DNA binding protein
MSESTRVTEKGQATIPKELRERYDIEPGDEVVWLDTGDGIIVRKRSRSGGRGMLVPDDLSREERESVADELASRLRGRRDEAYEED